MVVPDPTPVSTPDDPRADWHFGYVMQAMIRESQLTGEPVEDSVYESALGAFEL